MAKRSRSNTTLGLKWPLRKQQLITLDDQGTSYAIPTSIFRFDGRDQSWNSHAESFLTANRPQLTALNVESRFSASSSEIRLELRAGGTIGAIPLYTPDSRKVMGGVVVRPRFGWNGIGTVLSRIGWSASPQLLDCPLVPGSAREIPPWVLAGPILLRLRRMLSEVKRGFTDKEEVRQTPRGQIMWGRYVTNELSRGLWHHIPCRFPELGFDPYLRSYIKWGLECLRNSLAPHVTTDVVARLLMKEAQELIQSLTDTQPCYPENRVLHSILHRSGLPTANIKLGIEALSWLVDERGLAGTTEQDGLAWVMPMSDLFEKWLCYLVAEWAKAVGGTVNIGYRGQTLVPINWERPSHDSLSSLIPDIVARVGNHTFIFDAKYKGHFEEMDERHWLDAKDELHEQHRHDIHQVLAYAALYDATEVTAVLAYPMRLSSWENLSIAGRTDMQASIYQGNRNLRLVLLGVPLQLAPGDLEQRLLRNWISVL